MSFDMSRCLYPWTSKPDLQVGRVLTIAVAALCTPDLKVGLTGYLFRYVVAGLASSKFAPDIRGHLVLVDRFQDRRIDRRGFFLQPQRFEHQRRRRDRADRVGDVLPRELRRRAVHRLEHRRLAGMDVP